LPEDIGVRTSRSTIMRSTDELTRATLARLLSVLPPYGMTCTECNELVIAPKSSAHVSNHEVRHFWSCDNCGHEIEMSVNLRIDAASGLNKSIEASVVA
jgi:transcription elongation factor Elf1